MSFRWRSIQPTNPDIVYAGSYKKIYKSTNGGTSWIGYSATDYYIYDLAVHPTTPSTLFAAGRYYTASQYVMGFFKSTNGGVSWTGVGLNTYSGLAYSLALDPSDPDNIYVGGYSYISTTTPKVYRSTNGGSTFTDVSTGISSGYYVYSLAFHPTNSNIAYAGTYSGGIYRTTNGGSSWSKVSSYNYIWRMATTGADPDVAYAGGRTAVYKSTNSGASWTTTGSGISGDYIYGLYASQNSSSNVFASNNSGFYKTTNGGSNWVASNNGMNIANILTFSPVPGSPAEIYASCEDMGIFKTTNSGSEWTAVTMPLSCGDICGFAFDYSNPSTMFGLEGLG